MGKVKRLELWWQLYLYVTSGSGVRKKPAITLCAFECTKMHSQQIIKLWEVYEHKIMLCFETVVTVIRVVTNVFQTIEDFIVQWYGWCLKFQTLRINNSWLAWTQYATFQNTLWHIFRPNALQNFERPEALPLSADPHNTLYILALSFVSWKSPWGPRALCCTWPN
jgi:hypothetical protein